MQYKKEEDLKKVDSILRIIEMEGIEEEEQLLDKLRTCHEYDRIEIILRDYPIYRSDVNRRNFLFEHEDNLYLKQIARLLKRDSVFNDKAFVDNLILKTKNSPFIWEKFLTLNDLSNWVEFNSEKVTDNGLLRITIDISSSIDSLKFARLLNINYFIENPLWLFYFAKWCNKEKSSTTAGILKNVDVDKFKILEKNEKMDMLYEKLLEIDFSEKPDEEKIHDFSKLVEYANDLEVIKEQSYQKRIGTR